MVVVVPDSNNAHAKKCPYHHHRTTYAKNAEDNDITLTNNNGKQELFIDAGYAFGMPWKESYYLFEYDDNSIELVKNFIAGDWTERLGVSDHFKAKFEVSEDELSKIIIEKF